MQTFLNLLLVYHSIVSLFSLLPWAFLHFLPTFSLELQPSKATRLVLGILLICSCLIQSNSSYLYQVLLPIYRLNPSIVMGAFLLRYSDSFGKHSVKWYCCRLLVQLSRYGNCSYHLFGTPYPPILDLDRIASLRTFFFILRHSCCR